ncbi:YkgB family protein [Dongia sp.]|uniref:YkgB family protein n=1 Tax=Dongia sp. TaxID=1977262 RepID=UPI0035B3CB60
MSGTKILSSFDARNALSFDRHLASAERLGTDITRLGAYGIFASLAVIYFWFGGMKFTAYEAQGLVPLVENSPFLSWMYEIFSVRGFSTFLGFVELSIGLLIAGRILTPTLSAIGGFLSAGLFATTLSFMISTPGVIESGLGFPAISVAPGQFLLKDIGLLAGSVFILGHSLSAMARKRASRSMYSAYIV